ncbi:NAD(P)H-hydrate dehydratase [Leuconostocaceae bacterium ESL0723]|nr:NAD(P)H-hydrate dehydratase [Leuconostocaceae bacterium ESL0723]
MQILTDSILKEVIVPRQSDTHKGNYGKVLIIGGTDQLGGATLMNSLAAVNSGAGLVSVATDPVNFTAVHSRLPEAMVIDFHQDLTKYIQSVNVVLIGSGLGNAYDILEKTLPAIQANQTLIIDGSALTMLSERPLPLPDAQLIFTPHQMEWQRFGQVKIADQVDVDNNWAALKKIDPEAILVLKSNHTQIYWDNEVYQLSVGGPYQATGGMGDTLAGMVAGFTAQFHPQGPAVLAATYAHSAIAQELAQKRYVTLPTLISASLPEFMYRYAGQ